VFAHACLFDSIEFDFSSRFDVLKIAEPTFEVFTASEQLRAGEPAEVLVKNA
jgi:hypothetical protein